MAIIHNILFYVYYIQVVKSLLYSILFESQNGNYVLFLVIPEFSYTIHSPRFQKLKTEQEKTLTSTAAKLQHNTLYK